MSITDELREYARGCAGGMGGDALRHIADSIEDAAHEEAKRVAKLAFEGGIEYERTCRQYNCDAKAYNWDGWLKSHAALFSPKPTVEDVLREFTGAILEWSGKSGSVAEVGTLSDIAAQYAAKLRMAGDAE